MRRVGRWILNALTVLAVLLSAAVLTLWIRSLFCTDILYLADRGASRRFLSDRGKIWYIANPLGAARGDEPREVGFHSGGDDDSDGYKDMWEGFVGGDARFLVDRGGIRIGRAGTWGANATLVVLPYWFLAALGLPLPLCRLYARRRLRSRQRHNLCLTCSYNLTGNVSGVCPECGTQVEEQRSRPHETAGGRCRLEGGRVVLIVWIAIRTAVLTVVLACLFGFAMRWLVGGGVGGLAEGVVVWCAAIAIASLDGWRCWKQRHE